MNVRKFRRKLVFIIAMSAVWPVSAMAQEGNRIARTPSPLAIAEAFREPLPPVQALPGLEGFEIKQSPFAFGIERPNPAVELANEALDVEWASEMRRRILAEIPNTRGPRTSPDTINDQITRIEAECRTTWCGVVLQLADGVDTGIGDDFKYYLKDKLKFKSYFTYGVNRADHPDFVAIYLKADR